MKIKMTERKTTNNIRGAGRKPSGRICISVSVTLTPKAYLYLKLQRSMGGFIAALIEKKAEEDKRVE